MARMTAKQIKYFGTKAQKAALRRKRSGGRTTARKKTTRRRRRSRKGKIAIAETGGLILTGMELWKRYQIVSKQTYVGKPKYTLPEALIATFSGGYIKNMADGSKKWIMDPQAMFDNVQPIYTPAVAGWGISKFIGGRGYKGSGGLNLNQKLLKMVPIFKL